MNKAIITAELGNTHIGDMTRAKKLIRLAKNQGVNVVKFQKRNPEECIREDLKHKPHPNPQFSYGDTYLEHRIAVELDVEAHRQLKIYCEGRGMIYASSVFDLTSAKEIISLEPQMIKIPSCCNTHWRLIDYVLNHFNGEVHISMGMTTREERDKIYFRLKPHLDRVVAYHCTSEYPCPCERSYLIEIKEMQRIYPVVGFSDHSTNIGLDIAAYVYGATHIERHFIDDRSFRHTDSASSLEPQEMRQLRDCLDCVTEACRTKPDEISDEEKKQADKLRYYE